MDRAEYLNENVRRIKATLAMGSWQPGYIANLNDQLARYETERDWPNGTMCYIPSGMGGVFPALIVANDGPTVQVYCCNPDFYPAWLLTVKVADLKPWDGLQTERMKKLIAKIKKLAGLA